MNFYTNSTFKIQKGRSLGSHDPISNFWDHPYNLRRNQAIRFKFGKETEDELFLRTDHKTTSEWAWSRDPVWKFWDHLITFERIKLSASNLVHK